MTVTLEQLADLTPNMRKALLEADSLSIRKGDTYWITLQGLVGRGLVIYGTTPETRWREYPLTALGRKYQEALQAHETRRG